MEEFITTTIDGILEVRINMDVLIEKLNGREQYLRCVEIIIEAFKPVAARLKLTEETCPSHPSFYSLDKLTEGIKNGMEFFGLFYENKMIGTVAVQKGENGYWYLEKLAIEPGFQRKQYGNVLVNFVIEYVKKQKCRVLSIGIVAELKKLKEWYENIGFRQVSTKKFDHLPFDVCFMDYNIYDKRKLLISASLWSADLSKLGSEIQQIENYCDVFHFDIMDGNFVDNIIFGFDFIKQLRPFTKKPFDIHLMVKKPEKYLDVLVECGADKISFHPETVDDVVSTIQQIKCRKKSVGLAINVDIGVEQIYSYLEHIDYLVVMGTKIGIKGVDIDPIIYDKIRQLCKLRNEMKLSFEIQCDGGIRTHTIEKLYESGADCITAGSVIFNENRKKVHEWIKSIGQT